MARYSITVWDVDNIVKQRHVTRSTAPAAWHQFRKAVYDVLEAFGKLDTPAAHDAYYRAKRMQDILQPGEERGFEVSNTRRSVIIIRGS